MKGKDAAAAWIGVEPVGEEGLHAGALVEKRQRRVPGQGDAPQADGVLGRLRLDAAQCRALRLGLHSANGPAIDEQQVVGVNRRGWVALATQGELAHGDADGRAQVHLGAVLDLPTHIFKQCINPLPGLIFGLHQSPAATYAGRESW